MGAETRVRVRRVVIGVPSATQDGSDFDSALQTLLAKGKALELLEAVLVREAVDDGISKEILSHARDESCGLGVSATTSVFWVG